MSRKRTGKTAPLLRPVHGDGRGAFPADRFAGVRVVDAAGHQLVIAGRFYVEGDPARVWWSADSIHDAVTMVEDDAHLTFTCASCSDRGARRFAVAVADVVSAVNAVWGRAARDGRPRVENLRAEPL